MKSYATIQLILMRISAGKGKYQVWFEKHPIGSDILFILGGGQIPHIGGIVVCEPDQPPQIIKLGNHYDHQVLQPLAETACKRYNTTIVAVGGIHIDQATKEDISKILENCKKLREHIEK